MMTRKLWMITGLGWGWIAATAWAAPQIAFDRLIYDFGTTAMVQSVTGTFTFENKGDAPLVVQRPLTSCGCTVAAVTPDKLQPGEKGELVFTLNIANVRGLVEKTITVPSNDPTNQQTRLTIKVDARQLYDVSPTVLLVGDIAQGTQTNWTLLVRRNDRAACVLSKIETSSEALTATIEPLTDAKSLVQVRLALNATGGARRLQEWVRFYADGGATPIATVYLHGRIVGELSVQPESIYWIIPPGLVWPGPAPDLMTTRRLEITAARPGEKIRLSNPSCSLSNVTVEIVPVEDGRRYTVVAKMTAPPPASANGTLRVETNLPSQPSVVVPITVNVLRK